MEQFLELRVRPGLMQCVNQPCDVLRVGEVCPFSCPGGGTRVSRMQRLHDTEQPDGCEGVGFGGVLQELRCGFQQAAIRGSCAEICLDVGIAVCCRGPESWRRDRFGEDLLAMLVEVVREPVAGHLGALPVGFRRQRADCSPQFGGGGVDCRVAPVICRADGVLVGQVADCGAVQEPRCAPPQADHARDVHCRGDHGAGVRVCSETFVVVQEVRDASEVLDDPPGLVFAGGRRDGLGQGGIRKLPCPGQVAFAEFLR